MRHFWIIFALMHPEISVETRKEIERLFCLGNNLHQICEAVKLSTSIVKTEIQRMCLSRVRYFLNREESNFGIIDKRIKEIDEKIMGLEENVKLITQLIRNRNDNK